MPSIIQDCWIIVIATWQLGQLGNTLWVKVIARGLINTNYSYMGVQNTALEPSLLTGLYARDVLCGGGSPQHSWLEQVNGWLTWNKKVTCIEAWHHRLMRNKPSMALCLSPKEMRLIYHTLALNSVCVLWTSHPFKYLSNSHKQGRERLHKAHSTRVPFGLMLEKKLFSQADQFLMCFKKWNYPPQQN